MIAKAITYLTAGDRFSMPGIADSKTQLSRMATGGLPLCAAGPGWGQSWLDVTRPPKHVADVSLSGTGFVEPKPGGSHPVRVAAQRFNGGLTITAAKAAELSSRAVPMAITDLPLVSMLKDRLHWHQARQKVLAENVANANTPGFKPMDLREPSGPGGRGARVELDRTSPLHIGFSAKPAGADPAKAARFETRPSGNAVNLEDEMLKTAANQSSYQLATSLYQKSLGMLRIAAGVRGSA
jgi:flagellar basal-body rod protein FlgB